MYSQDYNEDGLCFYSSRYPQKAGYQNGTSEVALLNQPVGLVIDSDDIMYIGDSENAAIRRLAIE